MKEKKCPLFFPRKGNYYYIKCLKDECAWWDDVAEGECSVKTIVGNLDKLVDTIPLINPKLVWKRPPDSKTT